LKKSSQRSNTPRSRPSGGRKIEVTDKGTPALNGKQSANKSRSGSLKIRAGQDQSAYLSAGSRPETVPMFFSINFGAVQNAVDDPGIALGEIWDPRTNTRIPVPKGRGFGRMNVEAFSRCRIRCGYLLLRRTSIPIIRLDSPMASAYVISSQARPNALQMTGARLLRGHGA